MAVGAHDYIDRLLVKKYSQEKVDNHDEKHSMVDPEKMMDAMTDYAQMCKNMSAINQRLRSVCAGVNARSAQYRKAATLDEYTACC